jgi:hypothetical protein
MIKIENKKTYRGEGIYIGRPSLLGNPFEIGVHGERGDVIKLYRRWLWDRILEQGEVYAELKRLARLTRRGRSHPNLLVCSKTLPWSGGPTRARVFKLERRFTFVIQKNRKLTKGTQ